MYNKVIAKIEEKVDEIFFEMQEELGIENGDILPDGLMKLYLREEQLAEIITAVLSYQKGE